nr:hypothetical protein [Tanacetum cinerariifolium]
MACSLSRTDDEVEAFVQKLIDEDMIHPILNLALQFDNACTAKDDLRKAYKKYKHQDIVSRSLLVHHTICKLFQYSGNKPSVHLENGISIDERNHEKGKIINVTCEWCIDGPVNQDALNKIYLLAFGDNPDQGTRRRLTVPIVWFYLLVLCEKDKHQDIVSHSSLGSSYHLQVVPILWEQAFSAFGK